MKLTLLPVLLLLAALPAPAQDKKKESKPFKPSVAIKFAPAGLVAGKITFGGEFNFKHKQSITLLAGIPYNKTYPINYQGNTSNLTVNATSYMASYRYYLGKRDMSGFYVEPYAKYLKFQATGPIHGNINNRPATFDSEFDYKGFGAGIQLGMQFMIARTIVFDFFLIGPEANSADFSSRSTDVYNSVPWSQVDAQQAESDIKDKLKDIPLVGDKITVTVDQNAKSVYTAYKGFAPGFRAGAAIGIRF